MGDKDKKNKGKKGKGKKEQQAAQAKAGGAGPVVAGRKDAVSKGASPAKRSR